LLAERSQSTKIPDQMDPRELEALLRRVASGDTDVAHALRELERLPFENLGYARVDHHRALRMGAPEVVLGQSKTPQQIVGIAQRLLAGGHNVLVTRLDADKSVEILKELPQLSYSEAARVASCVQREVTPRKVPPVALVTAGTSDIPVAEEAAETLKIFGIPFERVFDVGVAGIHRVLGEVGALARAPAVIVVAGMEGALPSVVGGLVRTPIIAVPTSVGYGVAFNGLTALCGMLTGCASGITVVNIDNGFGAAMAVHRIVASEEARREAEG
jgi:NCAIR mutase (PurE)-related protein